MYKITSEIGEFLIKNSREAQIPGIKKDTIAPFVPRNPHAIGYSSPFEVMGSSLDYVVASDHYVGATELTPEYQPEIEGYWLYRGEEFVKPTEPVFVARHLLDASCLDLDEMLDITDCCVADVSLVERLTCPVVTSLKRLLELEPGLKKCLMSYPED